MKELNLRSAVVILGLAFATGAAAQPSVPPSVDSERDELRIRYRSTVVRGVKIFYREAGNPGNPSILLLHGFPASSHMYRELLPLLAKDFHLVAPDYPGSGFSDYPPADRFIPSFENLAGLMSAFVQQVGLSSFTIYMQDFGGPVGFRMAVKHPGWVNGLIVQNANAYLDGIAPEQLKGMRAPQRQQTEQLVSREFTIFMYKTGARRFDAMDPTGWNLDSWILENSEAKRIQTELMLDYHTNLAEYPRWQAYLRTEQPRTLIVWGRNDPIFLPAGAEAYRRDIPQAKLQFYDAGHFALEEEAPAIASEIRKVFTRR